MNSKYKHKAARNRFMFSGGESMQTQINDFGITEFVEKVPTSRIVNKDKLLGVDVISV